MKMILSAVSFVLIGMCCSSAIAATECVWIGGESGNLHESANWSNGTVPNSDKDYRYVAVFTNSVTIKLTQYWYPIGVVVSNNSEVTVNGDNDSTCRCFPSQKCENFTLSMDVDVGSKLTFNVYLYSQHSRNLIKKGGGELIARKYFGNPSSKGSYFGSVDVKSGTLRLPGGKVSIDKTLFIRSGAKVVASGDWPFIGGKTDDYRVYYPKIEIEDGGTLDMNGKAVAMSTLSGAGDVVKCSSYLDFVLRDSGSLFSGRISGGGQLRIQPNASWTATDATWIVGSADTLSGVKLVRNTLAGCNYEIQFVSDIETFYAKEIPNDMPSFDTNGVPVEIARSGNFWYVDCKRTGEKGDGKSLESAFQTLKEAMEVAQAGDTVWVDEGEYITEPMSATQSSVTTYSRVIVPSNVRLVSLKGPAATVIVGDSAEGNWGCGEGAVRCATLGANATLRGFTLRDGRVNGTQSANDATSGGGVFADPESIIIDCVISNCTAFRGGGAYRGNFYNCRFEANRATQSQLVGDHLYGGANIYNCVLTRNLNGYSWYANGQKVKAVNCTFDYSGKGGIRSAGTDSAIFNSLIMAAPETYSAGCFDNCIVYTSSAAVDEDSIKTSLTATTSPTIYSFAGVDSGTLRPKKHNSLVVVNAAADSEYAAHFAPSMYWLSRYDAASDRRAWNGKVDIGAFSYDHSRPIPGFWFIVR